MRRVIAGGEGEQQNRLRVHAEKLSLKYPLPFSLPPLPLCHYPGSAPEGVCPSFAGSVQCHCRRQLITLSFPAW